MQLELFDLDEAFSSEKARLAQITNKCTDDDIDYYVREAADILGVTQNVPNLGGVNTSKRILEYVLAHVIEFKKLNQDVNYWKCEVDYGYFTLHTGPAFYLGCPGLNLD